MNKLVKDLKDGDLVYIVYKDCSTIVECIIKIEFNDPWQSPEGYFTKSFNGCVYSSLKKLTKDHFGEFQVFRIGTAGIWNKELAEKNNITEDYLPNCYPCRPGSIPLDEFDKQLNSTRFEIYHGFDVFTNIEDAKDHVVNKKLENIRKELKQYIKIIKYKKREKNGSN